MTPLDADVIIVGAGLSGLSAAENLHRAGVKVLVIEARDRVGGKTWSHPFGTGNIDLGAAWINDTNQNRMYSLVKRFGLETTVQNTHGNFLVQDLGGKKVHNVKYGDLPADEVEEGGSENSRMIRDLFESLCHKMDIRDPASVVKTLGVDFDTMNVEELIKHLGGGETSLGMVSCWTRAMLGLEPDKISALYFLVYCESGGGIMQMRSDRKDGAQFLRLIGGTQAISKCLAVELPPGSVILNHPVTSICNVSSHVVVSTAARGFTASRVILSLPTTLYKTISFSPELPASKQQLVSETRKGSIAKVFLAYTSPWWRSHGLCGLTQSFQGLITVTRDVSVDANGLFVLFGFIIGENAKSWSQLPANTRRSAVLNHLNSVFGVAIGEKPLPEPIDYLEHVWWKEDYSQGCPCPVMPPGLMSGFDNELRKSVGKLHFVGTETAWEWKGYMEGAVRSGERGASEVLASFVKASL